jgi:hypothetical protein
VMVRVYVISKAWSVVRAWFARLSPDPESKRHMSTILVTLGVLAVSLAASVADVPQWILWVGVVLVVIAWMLGNAAAGQQRLESRATDFVEWLRETQEFRRDIGEVWAVLRDAYRQRGTTIPTLEQVVGPSGWPDSPGETSDELAELLSHCLPPSNVVSVPGDPVVAILGDDRRLLLEPFRRVKGILEIWSHALRAGGSRATSLREAIVSLTPNHLDSLRLMWWLTITHSVHVDLEHEPDYRFLEDIRNVMIDSS